LTLSASLYAYLSVQGALTALIGDRLMPFPAPSYPKGEAPVPLVVYRQNGLSVEDELRGNEIWQKPLIAFAVFVDADQASGGYDVAHQISNVITSLLIGFKGQMGGSGGVHIEHIKHSDERDDYDDQTDLLAVLTEFEITYR
jgi:hypothetical protein